MTRIVNLRGTSETEFRIGVTGPTVYTGNTDPTVTPPTAIDSFTIGDFYLYTGGSGVPWTYDGSGWGQLLVEDASGNLTVSNDLIVNNDATISNDLTVSGQALFSDGTAANPSISFTSDTDTGVYRSGTNTLNVTAGGSDILAIQDGGGVDASIVVNSTDAVQLPSGTTAEQPSTPVEGMIRYNSSNSNIEMYVGGNWSSVGDMLATNNLSDLANIATARTNLGLTSGGAGDIWVDTAGDTMTGPLDMGGQSLSNPLDPGSGNEVGDRDYNDFRYLRISNDLSDLTSAATARTNLGLVSGGSGDIWVDSTGDTMTGDLNMTADITPTVDGTYDLGSTFLAWNFIYGRATSALYADVAERYESDQDYPVGSILVVGGDKEVTTTNIPGCHRVVGVVSENPAFMMNNRPDNQTWPFLALSGRVPVRVVGKVTRGDRIGTSTIPGVGSTLSNPDPGSVVGIALEDADYDSPGLIEIVVRPS